jgi:hypothetical protein
LRIFTPAAPTPNRTIEERFYPNRMGRFNGAFESGSQRTERDRFVSAVML